MNRSCLAGAASLLLLALLPGCEYLKDPGLPGRPRWYINSPPRISTPEEVPEGYNMYVTAFEYPEGYDYIRDTLHGAGASVVLYRDGARVLTLPADGLSPDECRVVNGRLYTPVRTGEGTEIRCNGEVLFSYPEEETIENIVSDGESVLTLGRRLSGGGFTCREDGEVLFSSDRGIPVGPADGDGALRLDENGYTLFYGVPTVSAGAKKSLYYMVRNGAESQLSLPEDVVGLFDAVMSEESVYLVASTSENSRTAALFHDGERRNVSSQTAAKISGLRLFSMGGSMYVTGFQNVSGRTMRYVWDSSCRILFRKECRNFNWIYPSGSGYYCVERSDDGVMCYLGNSFFFQTPGRFWSNRCAVNFGGRFLFAVLEPDGRHSTVYGSDGVAVLTVEGVVTEVCYSALVLPDEEP